MSAVDEIEVAIAKLTGLRNQAQPGPWSYSDIESIGGGSLYGAEVRVAQIHWDNDDTRPIHRPIYELEADASGALIVTLHRTIDAQLAILREAAEQLTDKYGGAQLGPDFYRSEIGLARAINGTTEGTVK